MMSKQPRVDAEPQMLVVALRGEMIGKWSQSILKFTKWEQEPLIRWSDQSHPESISLRWDC